MYELNFAVYLGEETEEGFTGFIFENNLCIVLRADGELIKEKGRDFLKKLTSEVGNAGINHLSDFDNFISKHCKEMGLPAHFSLSAGLLKDDIFYLKTIGKGEILIGRDRKLAKLIDGDNSASGIIKVNDFFVFATQEFFDRTGSQEKIQKLFNQKKPNEIVNEITPQIKSGDDRGLIAVFLHFEEFASEEPIVKPQTKLLDYLGQKRTLGAVAVVLLFLLFLWSVFSGYQKRIYGQKTDKIRVTKEIITEKLQSAEDVFSLNQPRANILISEAKSELAKLKKETRDSNNKEIKFISELISEKEKKILKTEEKGYEEYFDLSLENKQAKGKKIYLDKEKMAVLDPNGFVYIISLEKKSLDKRNTPEIKNATLIALSSDNVFFYSPGGIYKISSSSKTEKVIEKDKDWKDIKEIVIYNNNVYLLDRGANQVYKYLVGEKGFSAKNLYFKPGTDEDLKEATSMTIDSSVYISMPDRIFKYIGGVKDNFTTSFPQEDVSINKIFTNSETEKIFCLDKDKGVIYVLSKTGDYERQVKSSILKKADDFVVFENGAYVLSGSKIYKISLD